MGSSRRRQSTISKAKSSAAAKRKRSKQRPKEPAPDVDPILGRLLNALSIISTAANAMTWAQEREGLVEPDQSSRSCLELLGV